VSERTTLFPPELITHRISRVLAWIAGAIVLLGCGLLITIDVITRYFFKRAVVESFEISGYALAACVGLGLAFTVTSKANIRVDILLGALPTRVRPIFDLLAATALAVTAAALAWFTWKTLAQSWAMDAKSVSRLQTPMVLPQGIWWVGLVWFAATAILVPVQAALRLVSGDRDGTDALIGTLQIREEIEQAGLETREAERP
jgi:TRAP-type C4-dicarboxylate transport system permease small subunit